MLILLVLDPDTIVQESNDVELLPRAETTSSNYAYTSLGANLGISRNGVIKQWKFYSTSKGFSTFQVWRPKAGGGTYELVVLCINICLYLSFIMDNTPSLLSVP